METQRVDGISGAQLKSLIERIETLEHDKTNLVELIRDVFAEAKNEGFDVKVMRQVVKLRRMKKNELEEQEELLELYRRAIGDL